MTKFQTVDPEKEKKLLAEDSVNSDYLLNLAREYDRLVEFYWHKKSYFINSRMRPDTVEAHKALLRELMIMAEDNGVTPQLFLRAQFEMLARMHSRPSFSVMISARAPERLREYQRLARERQRTPAEKHIHRIPVTPEAEITLIKSIRNFHSRLERVFALTSHIDEEVVVKELEVMVRGGDVSKMYLAVAPAAEWLKSEYLHVTRLAVVAGLDEHAVNSLNAIHSRVLAALNDDKVKQYV